MLSLTHAAIAVAGSQAFLGSSDPVIVGLSIIGSQLPDIDTTTSFIGKICYPLSSLLEKRYPHRTVTHSFVSIAFVALVSLPLLNLGKLAWISLWLGMLLSVVADTFTIQGCQLFWPIPCWCYSGSSNPKKRIGTGSVAEFSVLFLATALAVGLWFNFSTGTGGGIVATITERIGVSRSIEIGYNRSAGQYQVFANFTGNYTSDRAVADGRYLILDKKSNFILEKDDMIYQLDKDIEGSIKLDRGDRINLIYYVVPFDEESIVEKLKLLEIQHPSAKIWLTGDLTVDLPDEITINPTTRSSQTLSVAGNTAKLFYLSLDSAIEKLEGQYGSGTLEARGF